MKLFSSFFTSLILAVFLVLGGCEVPNSLITAQKSASSGNKGSLGGSTGGQRKSSGGGKTNGKKTQNGPKKGDAPENGTDVDKPTGFAYKTTTAAAGKPVKNVGTSAAKAKPGSAAKTGSAQPATAVDPKTKPIATQNFAQTATNAGRKTAAASSAGVKKGSAATFTGAKVTKAAAKKTKQNLKPVADLPDTTDYKVVFIFPAGAGAALVSSKILEQMEADLGVEKLGEVMDMAAGVSSGSILAAAITYDNSRFSAREITPKTEAMTEQVFPGAADLAEALLGAGLSLDQLAGVADKLMRGETNPMNLAAGLPLSLMGSMIGVVQDKGAIITDLMKTPATNRKKVLKSALLDMFDVKQGEHKNFNFHLDENNRFLAVAADKNNNAILFGSHEAEQKLQDSYYTVPANVTVYNAIGASAAIPNMIASSKKIHGHNPNRLNDGALAVGFDPSEYFYRVYQDLYPNDNILMVYVANGSKIDHNFRNSIGFDQNKGHAENIVNGKNIIYAAIDVDVKGLFNLLSMYPRGDVLKVVDAAVDQSVQTKAYSNTVQMIKTAKPF